MTTGLADVRLIVPDGVSLAPRVVPDDERVTRFREELGLDASRPVVMAGHQVFVWHPGILAKRFAVERLAETHGAAAGWLSVDQDPTDPGAVSYPVERDGRWRRMEGSFLPKSAGWRAGVVAGRVGAFEPRAVERLEGEPGALVFDGLDRVRRALGAHAEAGDVVGQVNGAVDSLLAGVSVGPILHTSASAVARTGLFAAVVEDVLHDPSRCREALNTAIEAMPKSGLRALREGELPLWRVAEDGTRRLVREGDACDGGDLLPRGLLMTLLVRVAGCDLFVHGTGGLDYEPVADRWLSLWAPSSLAGLSAAAFVGVTADLTLPLTGEGVPTRGEVARAAWLSHSARHSPGLLGDGEAEKKRRGLVDRIAALPRHDAERDTLYRSLHALLEDQRSQHEERLTAFDRELESKRAAYRDREVLGARDWPFALYSDEALRGLRSAVCRSIDEASGR